MMGEFGVWVFGFILTVCLGIVDICFASIRGNSKIVKVVAVLIYNILVGILTYIPFKLQPEDWILDIFLIVVVSAMAIPLYITIDGFTEG